MNTRTIEESWAGYADKVIPKNASDFQNKELKQAFFGGAITVLTIMAEVSHNPDLSDEAAAAILGGLMAESRSFRDQVLSKSDSEPFTPPSLGDKVPTERSSKFELAMGKVAGVLQKVLSENWRSIVIVWVEGSPEKSAMLTSAIDDELATVLKNRTDIALSKKDGGGAHCG